MLRGTPTRRAGLNFGSAISTYLDVTIGDDPRRRRIEFSLNGKKCPMAAENFAKLCSGEQVIPPTPAMDGGIAEASFKDQFLPQLTYVGSSFHRVMRGFMIQGGDIVNGDGTGELSVFGETFDASNEVASSVFDRAGLLGTAVSAPHRNNSQFFILTAKDGATHLNGACICFGSVSKGMDVVYEIERVPVFGMASRPRTVVRFEAAGLL